MGWVVSVPDADEAAVRTGAELSVIERDGLRATLAGVAEAMAQPFLPFFIQRDPGIADPGAEGDAGGITWVDVAGDAGRLSNWLGVGVEVPVRVSAGDPAVLAVGIGDRELRW
jgi:hypothetical protein